MLPDILLLTKSYFNRATITEIAENLGENTSNVQNAVEDFIPAILTKIIEKVSTVGGVREIMNLLNENDDESVFDALKGLHTNPSDYRKLVAAGTTMLPVVLGEQSASISGIIANRNGLNKYTAPNLIAIVTSVLIGVVGKVSKSAAPGTSGLTSLLLGQQKNVSLAIPAGLAALLGLGQPGQPRDYAWTASSPGNLPVYATDSQKRRTYQWIPWLIAGLLFFIAIFGVKTYKNNTDHPRQTVIDSIGHINAEGAYKSDSSGLPTTDINKPVGDFSKRELPDGQELSIPEFGTENKLISFIENPSQPVDKTTWFNFDRINFESGSSRLDESSREQIRNIAAILKAFPAVSVKVGGYTDNTGDPAFNLRLSQQRADAVRNGIAEEGIPSRRIDAEGYGKEHPVASNDTEQGRLENRRIAIRVTKK